MYDEGESGRQQSLFSTTNDLSLATSDLAKTGMLDKLDRQACFCLLIEVAFESGRHAVQLEVSFSRICPFAPTLSNEITHPIIWQAHLQAADPLVLSAQPLKTPRAGKALRCTVHRLQLLWLP